MPTTEGTVYKLLGILHFFNLCAKPDSLKEQKSHNN